ncbi:hypothetical protein D9V86_02105 [Bacteroidetes/Chlorobi group bacterium ChocPot_Mid]|nr:MAG: hypothetical protein D9V86_02105 [Bacteroidetes/Chlorobi group bacterium ChocPot_Mid]
MGNQKEKNERLVQIMKQWQEVEDASIRSTTDILKKSSNPIVHIIMEIIRQDSAHHRKVQQMIIDHFEKETLKLTPEELVEFWDLVEEHDEIEKKTITLAKDALRETKAPLVAYLINYLLMDEKKHDDLLEEMSRIKSGMYPYGG